MRATSISQENIALREDRPVVVLSDAVAVESSRVAEPAQAFVRAPSSAAGAAVTDESPSSSSQSTPDTTQTKGAWRLPFRGWELPRSAQACILLNIGAALFGSNQVMPYTHSLLVPDQQGWLVLVLTAHASTSVKLIWKPHAALLIALTASATMYLHFLPAQASSLGTRLFAVGRT